MKGPVTYIGTAADFKRSDVISVLRGSAQLVRACSSLIFFSKFSCFSLSLNQLDKLYNLVNFDSATCHCTKSADWFKFE